MLGETDYSLYHILFWPGGGTIGLILWFLSVVMVGLVVQAFLSIRRTTVIPDLTRQTVQAMFDQKQFREAIEATSKDPSMLGYVLHSALSEAPRGYLAMERAMADAGAERSATLLRSVEWLNLMGNVAPMMGLLGTVWGMIKAFFAIVSAGGIPNPGMLAEALGIKLVCTFVGLVVAIPSLVVYGIMRNRIDGYHSQTMSTVARLINVFRPMPVVKKETPAPPAPPKETAPQAQQ
jgi:biopolymer transport protein ExbB